MGEKTRGFDDASVQANGLASVSGDDASIYDSDLSKGEAGSVFFENKISLEADFEVTFDTVMAGPDGLALVLHNDPAGASALGEAGIGMGHAGIKDGIAIEFDTFFNGAGFGNVDINDNSSVIRDTDFSSTDAAGNISTQVDLDSIADLNDGSTHQVKVNWDADSRTMSWELNEQHVATRSFTEAEIDTLFGGDSSVYIGITGAKWLAGTGLVKDFSLTADFICFAAGTRILTDRGERCVEQLNVGDLVQTMDAGLQPIRWLGNKCVSAKNLKLRPNLRPIRIEAGALADGVPETDLIVSPQHRVLLRSKILQRIFGEGDALVPAVKLLVLDGVHQIDDDAEVTYWHLLFDDHQIVFANGAAAESLLLGQQALKMVSSEALEEITALFPEIAQPGFAPLPARRTLRNTRNLRDVFARHRKNAKPLFQRSTLDDAQRFGAALS